MMMEHSLSISTAASERSQDSLFSPISFASSTPLIAKPLKLVNFYPHLYLLTLKKSPLRKKREMRVEGHRGAGLLEPENSLKAFQRAIDLEIDGVELDVLLQSFHDLFLTIYRYGFPKMVSPLLFMVSKKMVAVSTLRTEL